MEKIFWIGGSKGGVGKSAVSMALLDYLGESCPLLVETDTANPDVAKAYGNAVRTELLAALLMTTGPECSEHRLMSSIHPSDSSRSRSSVRTVFP